MNDFKQSKCRGNKQQQQSSNRNNEPGAYAYVYHYCVHSIKRSVVF